MKNLYNYNVFILILAIFFASSSFAGERILPSPKPKPSEDIKINTAKKKAIYPKKKPLSEIINEVAKKSEEFKSDNDQIQINIVIFPKKKPLIVTKKKEKEEEKAIVKSKILSKNDFALSKRIFELIDSRKWKNALKLSQRARNKKLYNLVNWFYLKESNNSASFNDYVTFINNNPNYPRINRLRYLAEHKINLKQNSVKSVVNWFDGKEPLSEYGRIKLGEIYILQGNVDQGSQLIKEGWVKAKLSKSHLKYLRKKYKKIITVSDNIKRADWHAWEGKHWDVQRMLKYLTKDYTALYRARQLLMSKSYGVDAAINNVPEKFKNDIGLKYDRLKWRRKRGRLDPSLEILFNIPKDPIKLIRPDIWWKERAILARSLIYKNKYVLAYKVSSNHSLKEGPKFAEAEWLSGWIAFTFLDDPNMALQHFKNFYNNVGYPISLARGGYWIGRTYKKINNNQKSKEWFAGSAKYLNTYYGQLSFLEINGSKSFSLDEQPTVSKKYEKEFNKNFIVDIIYLLHELNRTKYAKDFIKHLALLDVEQGSEILAGKLAVKIDRYDFAIQVSKQASYEKRFYNELNYPVIQTERVVNKKKMPKPELILSIIRQESEFDKKANSSAGARGMMQLMTYTAKLVAKQANLSYSKNRLKTDPNYNIKLGSYYLAGLLERYEGSYPFALAAYNAGPKRVKYWKKINGNPQDGKINYVDWIELIKFKETRNYVQRVLENINVYRYIISGKPIKIYNFFEDKTLY